MNRSQSYSKTTNFLYLGVDDLRLTPEESREYAAKAGAALSGKEAEELHRRAEGWIFSLFLHVRHYREKKTFAPASDFDGKPSMACPKPRNGKFSRPPETGTPRTGSGRKPLLCITN